MEKLPEAAYEAATKFAVVFDFDTDSCYPSPAVSPTGDVNPGMNVTNSDPSFVSGCREAGQLENSNTFHRMAVIDKGGVQYAVHMYALYFMKDKDLPFKQAEGVFGHRHDWEFALVWTTNNELTHASFSAHGKVTTEQKSQLHFDAEAPNTVKIVYHKNGPTTHSMRFAEQSEQAENHLGQWVTPTIVDWYRMKGNGVSNEALRKTLNEHDFGEADCSVNDGNFGNEISKNPPPPESGYPLGPEWKAVANIEPVKIVRGTTTFTFKPTPIVRGTEVKPSIDPGRGKRVKPGA